MRDNPWIRTHFLAIVPNLSHAKASMLKGHQLGRETLSEILKGLL